MSATMSLLKKMKDRVSQVMVCDKLSCFSRSLASGCRLVWLNLVVHKRNFVEWLHVIWRYYRCLTFFQIDAALLLLYLFRNPYKISKEFLIAKGAEDIHRYGETPLTTMEHIARECGLRKEDTVFELGCGRGRSCFWLNAFIGCKVIGIEWIPEFVRLANDIKRRCHVRGVEFYAQDMTKASFYGATVIYLYGTCLEEENIKKLVQHFQSLPSGTKIITVSYALMEFGGRPFFEVMKLFSARFTWGEADVYLQVKK